jgi:hypothetical protein
MRLIVVMIKPCKKEDFTVPLLLFLRVIGNAEKLPK